MVSTGKDCDDEGWYDKYGYQYNYDEDSYENDDQFWDDESYEQDVPGETYKGSRKNNLGNCSKCGSECHHTADCPAGTKDDHKQPGRSGKGKRQYDHRGKSKGKYDNHGKSKGLAGEEQTRRSVIEGRHGRRRPALARGAPRPRACAARGAAAARAATAGAAPGVAANAYLKAKVEEMARLQPVMVFSKSWCPFCTKENGIRFAVLELDNLGASTEGQLQDALEAITGARTVPRVFVGGVCVGGGTDCQLMAASGALQKMAAAAADKHTKDLKGEGEFQFDKDWQSELDSTAFRILRQRGTEPPGSHPYDKMLPEKGHFSCAGCGFPLYSASSKFASSCGWPVFNKVYESPDAGQHVTGRPDGTGSLEIVCTRCGSHLGHVFYDAVSEANPNGERH
ncbi:unnamed protein product [Prorocentrum cordatum]|uniref:MsrB domain-containing protein n=1 Tax=Prorocentrum cordatum TaxID=2364126 RepID=A0ABN9QSY7_9DINO|nr:unnamed protein product [Polarella glacialis]